MAKITAGIITAGGDAPGMNAAIRCCVRLLISNNVEVFGIRRGFNGLLERDFEMMSSRSVSGIINLGGTILKTSRCEEMKTELGVEMAAKSLNDFSLDYLIVIGGDGSFRAAKDIAKKSSVRMIGIPASIDNDIVGTQETIGFDTAVNTALGALDKIRDTATSHERLFVVEVMGRERGFIAITVGLAAGSEFILIPERPFILDKLIEGYKELKALGKSSTIIVMAEGVTSGFKLTEELRRKVDAEVRFSSIGYIQRGGSPTVRSRVLANLFGQKAVECLLEGKKEVMVSIVNDEIVTNPLEGLKRTLSDKDLKMLNLVEKLAI